MQRPEVPPGLAEFLFFETPDQLAEVLRKHPELLDERTDSLLGQHVRFFLSIGERETAAHIASRRDLLARLRAAPDPSGLNLVPVRLDGLRVYRALLAVKAGEMSLAEGLAAAAAPESVRELTAEVMLALADTIEATKKGGGGLLWDAYLLAELCYAAARASGERRLALAYSEVLGNAIDDSGDQSLLERRVRVYEEGMALLDDADGPLIRAGFQVNLANAYARLSGGRDRAANLAKAIGLYAAALPAIESEGSPADAALAHANLGMAYAELGAGAESPGEAFDRAEAHLGVALGLYTRAGDSFGVARVHNSLGNVVKDRWRLDGGRPLEKAVGHYEAALAAIDRFERPFPYADWNRNLGLVHLLRGGEGGRRRRRDRQRQEALKAVECFSRAATVYEAGRFPHQFARLQMDLASAYHELASALGASDEGYGEARRLARESLEAAERALAGVASPEGHADLAAHAAMLYLEGGAAAEQDVRRVVALLEGALAVRERDGLPLQVARARHNLASALFALAELVPDAPGGPSARGLELERQAVAQAEAAGYADLVVSAATRAGEHLEGRGDWDGARDWYLRAAAAGEGPDATAPLADFQEEVERWLAEVFHRLAAGSVRAGRLGDALAYVEQGRARLLMRRLRQRRAEPDPALHPPQAVARFAEARERLASAQARARGLRGVEFRDAADALEAAVREHRDCVRELAAREPALAGRGEALTAAQIAALVERQPGTAFLVLEISDQSALFFLLAPGRAAPSPETAWSRELPGSTIDTLVRWVAACERFRESPDAAAFAEVRAALDETLAALWDPYLAEAERRLRDCGGVSRVVLLPPALLGSAPLHAAGGAGGLLGAYEVCYAHSFSLYADCEARAHGQRPEAGLLCVGNPRRDLAWSDCETAYVEGLFGPDRPTVLRWGAATAEAVRAAVRGRRYGLLHFSCHGEYDWREPLRSGLLLAPGGAGGDRLSLAEVRDSTDLADARAVVLSACDVGRSSASATGVAESVSLPTALMVCGAACVVAALWPVDDLATAVLVAEFYDRLRGGATVAGALRGAQEAVREMDAAGLRRRVRSLDECVAKLLRDGGLPEAAREALAAAARAAEEDVRQLEAVAGARPFAHPYYWAGFCAFGAGFRGLS